MSECTSTARYKTPCTSPAGCAESGRCLGEFFERYIKLDSQVARLTSILRELGEQEGDKSLGAYLVVLQLRIERLVENRNSLAMELTALRKKAA